MLFCRILPAVFLLSASLCCASALSTPARAAGPAQDGGKTHKETGHIDSEAFLRAIVAVRFEDDAEAAKAFQQALAADPGNAELLRQALVRSIMSGSPDAGELARRVNELPASRNQVSVLALGNEAARQGRWTAALGYYRMAESDLLTHLIMPLLMAWGEQAQGHAGQAVNALLAQAQDAGGLTPFYTLHAALIARAGGMENRAQELLFRAQKLMSGSDVLTARSCAAWLWQHGQREKARAVLRALGDTDPLLTLAGPGLQANIAVFPVASAREGIARAYLLAAFILNQQGREQMHADPAGSARLTAAQRGASAFQFNEASRLMLGFALEMDPTLVEARLMLAEIQGEEGHPDAARETLLHVPPTDPLAPVAMFRLSMFDIAAGRLDDAIALLNKLSSESPEQTAGQAQVQRVLGGALLEKKDWAGAIAAYTRAMEFDRKHGAVDWALLSMRATTYYEAGDWPHARADARAALAYAPDEPSLLNFLGYSMTERHENLPEAEELLRKAHRLAPEEAAITDSLGWVRVEQGDVEGGLVLLEKAAEQIPEDPEVNYHLGEAYWRLGRRTEAVDQWNMALGLHPNPSDEKLIRAALERADMAPKTGVDEKKSDQSTQKGEKAQ
ncbi:MAG: tetratricopeptide repeat protein [Acetobacter papayae]|uniref:tetratricopeptide repeat protein n=1 Tax=Acetobacter papayae TaxID=1076592 RepID=UPI0039E9C3CE